MAKKFQVHDIFRSLGGHSEKPEGLDIPYVFLRV